MGNEELSGKVREALHLVLDPELGISIVELGLVYGIEVEDGVAKIEYTLTTMGCPIGPLIEEQMQQVATQIPGVEAVDARMVFSPPWSPEMMSEEARASMGML